MKLSQITSIGWCANMMIDRQEQSPFSLADIYRAADEGALVRLLESNIDDSGIIELWAQDPATAQEVEAALADAVESLRGRELRKTGAGGNPLCVVIAIVLETLQQQFSR